MFLVLANYSMGFNFHPRIVFNKHKSVLIKTNDYSVKVKVDLRTVKQSCIALQSGVSRLIMAIDKFGEKMDNKMPSIKMHLQSIRLKVSNLCHTSQHFELQSQNGKRGIILSIVALTITFAGGVALGAGAATYFSKFAGIGALPNYDFEMQKRLYNDTYNINREESDRLDILGKIHNNVVEDLHMLEKVTGKKEDFLVIQDMVHTLSNHVDTAQLNLNKFINGINELR